MQCVGTIFFVTLLSSCSAETIQVGADGFLGSLAQDAIPLDGGDGYKAAPVFEDAGQNFDGSGQFMNINKAGGYQGVLGGGQGFSFFARVRFDALNEWSRIFDFGFPDNNYNIVAGIIKDTPIVFFEIHPGDVDGPISWMSSQEVQVKVGEENAWLFVVKGNGKMEIWRDGYRLLEKSGQPVPAVIRPNLLIGKPNWMHPDKQDKFFKGSIKDIRIFNEAVDWASVTRWRKAITWPGLTNGNFMEALQKPTNFDQRTPPGWDSQGTVFLASAEGVKNLGGPEPNFPNLLFTALESNGAKLTQTVHMLSKGTKYWVAFEAASSKGDGALLTVSVGNEEYISKVGFSSDAFSKQYFAFVATNSDGTMTLEFKNSSPMTKFGKPRVFVGNVKISDAPNCYSKYQSQAKCVAPDGASKKGIYSYDKVNETVCREKCENHRCAFMLYDPVTVEGHSHCEVYPECGTMAMYYGGSSGTLFRREPCAAGGSMSPETAMQFHLPDDTPEVHHPGFHNSTNSGNNNATGQAIPNPSVGVYQARDEFQHHGGDDTFSGGENTAGSVQW